MIAMLKQLQATPPPAPVKAVEEICVTCGGAHPYYQCLAAGGNTFLEFRDNIQGYVSATAANYNQGSGSLPSNTVANPKGKLKAITTRSGLVTDGPTIPTPPKSVTPEVGERVEETYTNPNLTDYTIKVPPPPASSHFQLTLSFVDYENDPRVPLILGRPFLRTARALIDVHGEEMILHDSDERLTLNMKHDTASYSNHPRREAINLINIFNVLSEDFLEIHDSEGCNFLSEILPDIDSSNDVHPYFDDDPLSGSTTYSSNSLLEEFTDKLAMITYRPDYEDNLQFDIESDLKEIEFLLYQDYSSPPRFDVYDDDFLEVESDADNFYDDPFDSKGEKIKEFKLLIDELDLPCDFLPYSEYGSITSQDFSRDDDLPSPNNEDKEKKLTISYASLVFEDFDPPFYEPLFIKHVPKSKMLLLFSSENEEKVFKPGIYTSGKAWDRYKDLLRGCPHHSFTELHQLDTFYNALNPADQDSLNAVAGGNLLEKSPQDALTIIENKSKVKENQEKDKIRTKPDENEKRGKAQQCTRPVTVEKPEKRRNTDSKDQYWQILEDVFNSRTIQGLILRFT
uniref:Reverse transcriptase domain-containing protein n=1 Tax=Tanacetum cinerariifolium TaxID=118510 RepID=A0A6L2J2T8_TANCI|nr:reverse transcriptase domain-containing protein [Tanacetum cinerariifolium]